MSSQAESLQQLMGFFQVKDGLDGVQRRPAAPRAPVTPKPPAPRPAPVAALPSKLNGRKQTSDHEFKRF
jgi:hypothetical protein